MPDEPVQPPAPPSQFLNPYEHISADDMLHRTTIQFSKRAYERIRRVKPQAGVLQTTINILLSKLINELDKRPDLSDSYNPDAYDFAVANCSITLGGSAGSPTSNILQRSSTPLPPNGMLAFIPSQAAHRNDGPGASPVAQQAARPQEPANAGSNTKKQRAGGSAGRTGNSKKKRNA